MHIIDGRSSFKARSGICRTWAGTTTSTAYSWCLPSYLEEHIDASACDIQFPEGAHLLNFSKMRARGGLCSPSLLEKGLTSHTKALAITGRSPGPSRASSSAPPSAVGSGSNSSFVPCSKKKHASQGNLKRRTDGTYRGCAGDEKYGQEEVCKQKHSIKTKSEVLCARWKGKWAGGRQRFCCMSRYVRLNPLRGLLEAAP